MFALKLFLVPALIGVITLIGRRWGPAMAGWLSGFPVVAGPILLLIAVEQGSSFAVTAAGGALTAVMANIFFCLGYSWCAMRAPWGLSLVAGLVGYCLAAYLLTAVALPDGLMFGSTLVVLWIASRAFPPVDILVRAAPALWPELPIRMVAAAVLVVIITVSATQLGPRVSGLFSAFPLLATILAVFSHSASGAGAAIHLLRGMVGGFYALSTFCFVLSVALTSWGMAHAFLFALAAAVVALLVSIWLRPTVRGDRNKALSAIAQPDPCIPKP